MVEDGKIWRISQRATERVPRTECVPATASFEIAMEFHQKHGHFGHKLGKLWLQDTYFWPGMDTDTR